MTAPSKQKTVSREVQNLLEDPQSLEKIVTEVQQDADEAPIVASRTRKQTRNGTKRKGVRPLLLLRKLAGWISLPWSHKEEYEHGQNVKFSVGIDAIDSTPSAPLRCAICVFQIFAFWKCMRCILTSGTRQCVCRLNKTLQA